MYINGKLVERVPLSLYRIHNATERELYIQGAVNELREKWSNLIKDQKLEPQFFIKGEFPFQ